MKDFLDIAMNPIAYWRTTDNTAVWLGGYVAAALAVVVIVGGAWAFITGVFSQASAVAGL